ncbi:MAG: PAS domain-containing protein [Paracoccaceae bacterium]|nr:PAS domain-containing protein [Paracoccaceae bacterium]
MGLAERHEARIIMLSDYRAQDQAEPDALALLRRAWTDLRSGHALPARAALEPRRIGPALASAFIVERIAPGQARLRVAGARLGALMGMELRGMPLSALFELDARDALADLLCDVFDAPCAARLTLAAAPGFGRPALSGDMLLLPMTDRDGAPNCALGGLVWQGTPGRLPRRLGIETIRRLPLPAQDKPAAPQPARFEMAEAATEFRPRPQLRVVASNASAD